MKAGVEVEYSGNRYLTTNYDSGKYYVSCVALEGNVGTTCQLPLDSITPTGNKNIHIDTMQNDNHLFHSLKTELLARITKDIPRGWQLDAVTAIANDAHRHIYDIVTHYKAVNQETDSPVIEDESTFNEAGFIEFLSFVNENTLIDSNFTLLDADKNLFDELMWADDDYRFFNKKLYTEYNLNKPLSIGSSPSTLRGYYDTFKHIKIMSK